MAIHDFLLVAFSVIVIVLSGWPPPDSRQIVEIRGSDNQVRHYSFDVGDPRLAALQRELARGQDRPETRSLAKAKWRAEVAEFYATMKANQTLEIVQVSYADHGSDTAQFDASQQPSNAIDVLRAQQQHWQRLHRQAESDIAAAKNAIDESRNRMPRIAIGAVTTGVHPASVYAFAIAMGICVAIAAACWTYLCPAIELESDSKARESFVQNKTGDGELRLVIPSAWVRVHQPFSVTLRRAVIASVVAGGFVSAAYSWLM